MTESIHHQQHSPELHKLYSVVVMRKVPVAESEGTSCYLANVHAASPYEAAPSAIEEACNADTEDFHAGLFDGTELSRTPRLTDYQVLVVFNGHPSEVVFGFQL